MKNILNKIKEPYYILKRYNPIRSTIQGVKNLIKWFIIIWNDRDWDYGWIYEILKFKLECMEKAFRSNNAYSKCSDKRADEIKRCIILLDRLSKDEYELQEDKKLEKKMGKT